MQLYYPENELRGTIKRMSEKLLVDEWTLELRLLRDDRPYSYNWV